LFMKGDITRVENGPCIKIVEFVGFVSARVAEENTFSSTRRKFITVSTKSLSITEAPKYTKVIVVGYFVEENLKRRFILKTTAGSAIDEVGGSKNTITPKREG